MFKPDDKVKCIKGSTSDNRLKEGTIYTVAEIYHIDGQQGVILKELGAGYLSRRFVRIEQDAFTLSEAEA